MNTPLEDESMGYWHDWDADKKERLITEAPAMYEALSRIANGQWPESISETEGTLAMREVARAILSRIDGKE